MQDHQKGRSRRPLTGRESPWNFSGDASTSSQRPSTPAGSCRLSVATATDPPPPARRRPGSGCAPGLVQASILILRSPGTPTTSPEPREMGTGMGTVRPTPKRIAKRRIPLPPSRFCAPTMVGVRTLLDPRWVQQWVQWAPPVPNKITESDCNATPFRVGRRGLEPRTYGLEGHPHPHSHRGKSSITSAFRTVETHPEPPSFDVMGLFMGLERPDAGVGPRRRGPSVKGSGPLCPYRRTTAVRSSIAVTVSLRILARVRPVGTDALVAEQIDLPAQLCSVLDHIRCGRIAGQFHREVRGSQSVG